MIDVIIPIRDRDHERLMLCIEHLREFLLINKIIVVDYNSKEPVWAPEELRVEIIRTNHLTWNKAHAINLGVKKSSADYIMTVDCDIIVTEELFPLIERSLALNNFIVNTNVRRIELNQVGEFKDMLQKSKPWFENGRNQLFNLANGGIQIYSRKFYDLVGGIHEGLGFYSGAMDNFMFYLARINGLNTVDLSMPIFHIEHEKKKELNFDLTKEEQDMALAFRQYKAMYLETMINNGIYKNESKIAEEEPDSTMLDQFKREYSNRNAIIDRAIKEKKDHVKICGQVFKIEKQKPSVLIVVINNYEQLPTYFVWDLFNLYNSTRQLYPDIDIQQVNACEVSLMRNMAIKSALGGNTEKKKYNYVVMLDTDHRYSPHFLTRFLNLMEDNNYEILTGLTDSKKETNGEHLSTQYYKIQRDINTKDNCVSSPEPEDKVIQVEASGPVGMVMNTKIFKKLSLPYYVQEYSKNEKKNEVTSTGSDLYFCYDKETQIMTNDGLKYIKDVTYKDKILTLNLSNNKMEYHHPENIISKYEEKMLHFKSKRLDLMVSKDQDLLVGYSFIKRSTKKDYSKPLTFVNADEINSKLTKKQCQYYVKKNGGKWDGNDINEIKIGNNTFNIKDYSSFMGWFLSEGNVSLKKRKSECKSKYHIQIAQYKPKYKKEIFNLLKRMNLNPKLYKGCITCYNKDLFEYLNQFGKTTEKFIPDEIKDLNKDNIEPFLKAFLHGDGTIKKDGNWVFYTSSEKLKDGLVELILKIGLNPTISIHKPVKSVIRGKKFEGKRNIWRISVTNKMFEKAYLRKAKKVDYNDLVYDVTVPNNTIYVVRNGKGCWSSNCKNLKKAGIKINVDLMTSFPHKNDNSFFNRGSIVNL